MCISKIKDIFNVFNKDVRYFDYDLSQIPTVGGQKHVMVNHFIGQGIVFGYTRKEEYPGQPVKYTPIKHSYALGNAALFTVEDTAYDHPEDYILHIKCIDITSLIVYGTVLI